MIKKGTIVKGKHLFDDTCTMYGEFLAPDKIQSSTDGLAIRCREIKPVIQYPQEIIAGNVYLFVNNLGSPWIAGICSAELGIFTFNGQRYWWKYFLPFNPDLVGKKSNMRDLEV